MPSPSQVHHVLSRRRAPRRFSAAGLRPRAANPAAPGEIPSGLTEPTGSITEPGRTIWKFATPRVQMHRGLGPVVTTARLVPLFWGGFWQSAGNPSVGDVHRAIADILASPYLSEVMQYGLQSLSLDPAMIVIAPGPPSPKFSGEDAKNMVWDLIDDDRFPEPDEDGGRIVYMVFAPLGSRYDDSGAAGAHNDATDYDFPFDTDHAWVGWCNHDTLDGITEFFTHELVEILTDPQPYGGWTAEAFGLSEGHNEIVDLCGGETGMVSGYRVSAYYSDRLKACVVPTFAQQFGISVSVKEESLGRSHVQLIGRTATTRHSICFSGTYEWTLIGQQRRVTLTAAGTGYVEPEFEWKVNGIGIPGAAGLGPATQPISTPADTVLDPLSLITVLAPGTATAKVVASGNVLVLESQVGEPPGDFEVICMVKEKHLPAGYHSARSDERAITVAGRFRVMDERFQSDLASCMHLKSVLARELMEEVVIPRIDLGDPPPVWVERVIAGLESDIERQARQARFLAHFVDALEPELAATLRALAGGVIALAHATRVSTPEQTSL